MGIKRYFLNEHGLPRYEADDERYWKLGVWMTMEIGGSYAAALDALDAVAEVLEGAGGPVEWEGRSIDARFTREELTLTDYDGTAAAYEMHEVRTELERYWRFLLTLTSPPGVIRLLRPDLPEHHAYLLQWEDTWKRRHPYRGSIQGIPADGPS
ncbi:hypothetical protein [Glycomyces sp. NPDC021274]|uniref:hypothetical protein n=1 Tax=Glycomyces sp. NPDC021274 TaxID=3155120 RepID=UPI0033F87C2F